MKTKTIIYCLIILTLCVSLYFYFNYSASYVSTVLSLFSIYVAIGSTILALNALEITKKTLELTEKQQKIRDIEKKLDFFYCPLKDCLERLSRSDGSIPHKAGEDITQHEKKVAQLEDSIIKEIDRIAPYKYLSKKETMADFDSFRREWFYDTAKARGLLWKYVDKDVEEYTKELNELNNSN